MKLTRLFIVTIAVLSVLLFITACSQNSGDPIDSSTGTDEVTKDTEEITTNPDTTEAQTEPPEPPASITAFSVPKEKTDREYLLLEFTKPTRKITFFCPEKHKNLDTVVWYFYMELFDDNGNVHILPGQVRVIADEPRLWQGENKPQFLKILEQVKLKEIYA